MSVYFFWCVCLFACIYVCAVSVGGMYFRCVLILVYTVEHNLMEMDWKINRLRECVLFAWEACAVLRCVLILVCTVENNLMEQPVTGKRIKWPRKGKINFFLKMMDTSALQMRLILSLLLSLCHIAFILSSVCPQANQKKHGVVRYSDPQVEWETLLAQIQDRSANQSCHFGCHGCITTVQRHVLTAADKFC